MIRLLKAVGLLVGCFVLLCFSAFVLSCVNTNTSAARAARLEADLQEKVPPGSGVEQVQEWLCASGFGNVPDLHRWANAPERQITLWVGDPAWLSSADMSIKLQFDEFGQFLSARITSHIVSL